MNLDQDQVQETMPSIPSHRPRRDQEIDQPSLPTSRPTKKTSEELLSPALPAKRPVKSKSSTDDVETVPIVPKTRPKMTRTNDSEMIETDNINEITRIPKVDPKKSLDDLDLLELELQREIEQNDGNNSQEDSTIEDEIEVKQGNIGEVSVDELNSVTEDELTFESSQEPIVDSKQDIHPISDIEAENEVQTSKIDDSSRSRLENETEIEYKEIQKTTNELDVGTETQGHVEVETEAEEAKVEVENKPKDKTPVQPSITDESPALDTTPKHLVNPTELTEKENTLISPAAPSEESNTTAEYQTAPSSAPDETLKPIVPKSRPHVSHSTTSDSVELEQKRGISKESSIESLTNKKPPPKVPKKPSSKIAAFQQMLEQQQQQDLGVLLNKPPPLIPTRRPTVRNSTSLDDTPSLKSVNDNDNDNDNHYKSKPVSRVNPQFAQSLNGMFGMPLAGMALGGDPIAALKATKAQQSEIDGADDESKEKVKDIRRARARGPRGRKLPSAVKETVEINDETLGHTRKILVHDLWSFNFKSQTEEPNVKDIEEVKDSNEEESSLKESNEALLQTALTKTPTTDSNENNEVEQVAGDNNDNSSHQNESVFFDSVEDSDSSDLPEENQKDEEPLASTSENVSPSFGTITSMTTTSDDSIISTTTESEVLGTADGSVLSESENST